MIVKSGFKNEWLLFAAQQTALIPASFWGRSQATLTNLGSFRQSTVYPLRWYFLPINVYKKSNILENLVLPTSFLRSLWTPPLLVGKFNLMHNECKVAGWCKSAYPTHFIKVTCLSSRMDDVHGGLFSRKNWPKNQLSDPKYIHSFKCCSGNFLFSVLKLV